MIAPPNVTETNEPRKPVAKKRARDSRERQELEGDHRDRDDQRRAVLRDQERKRVQNPAQEGAGPGDRPSISPVIAGCTRWSRNDFAES
jgi:hypothetical protein